MCWRGAIIMQDAKAFNINELFDFGQEMYLCGLHFYNAFMIFWKWLS